VKRFIITMAVIFLLCNTSACAEPVKLRAKVIDKIYVASSSSIGTGVSSKGTVITMVNSSSAKYLIFFEEDGEIQEVRVNKSVFFKINKGDYFLYWNKWHGRYFIEKEN
jgi:hypothetical protein